jgi:hypothetical protein
MENIETKTVRIKLKDIRKSPFRDFNIFPIDEKRVDSLVGSIEKAVFWSGLLARPIKGTGMVELAFGHHRLEAARKVYGEDHEIDLTVAELNDDQMIIILSKENDPAYNCSLRAIDNSVSEARKRLRAQPDKARALLNEGAPSFKRMRIQSPLIAKYLELPPNRVKESCERLDLIEKGLVNPAALYLMPSSAAADLFMKSVKGMNFDEQLTRATGIEQSKRFGKSSISDMMKREIPIFKNDKNPRLEHAEYCDAHLQKCTKFVTSALRELDHVLDGFNNEVLFGDIISPDDISINTKNDFISIMMKLAEKNQEVSKKLSPN